MLSEPSARAAPSALARVESLLQWWTLAGVDGAVTEAATNWLKPKAPPAPVRRAAPRGPAFPETLDAFRQWLADSPDIAEARWPGRRILPTGPEAPKLMIILPAPDSRDEPAAGAEADAAPAPLDPAAMRLLGRMMGAIGLSLPQVHLATLSLLPPPGGVIPPEIMAALALRMRHHIALVRPEALLLAGDQTSRALLSTEDLASAEILRFVNHESGKLPASSIFHPRLLLGQPSAKAGAWRALRHLVKGWGQ